MEGKDFFTKDIHDYLVSGKADFAVHSLKDVSGENFFNGSHYAIIEREDPRDAAIFHEDILDKLMRQDRIILGTSSPRRVEMARKFLLQALPVTERGELTIEAAQIRGNVDTRLQKLAAHEFDGVVLACAGLNRLLRTDRGDIEGLLKGKKLMILPLLACPPAPGQGAIVAETTPGNGAAVSILEALNNELLARSVDQERKIAHRYGSGCHQKFGVIHIPAGDQSFIYAAGKDRKDHEFSAAYSEAGVLLEVKRKAAAVDVKDPLFARHKVRLITPSDSIAGPALAPDQKVWVSETASWFMLANQGIWVEGSLEGMGLKFIAPTLTSPLVNFASPSLKES
jgi:hydroxymethylbilane synthase